MGIEEIKGYLTSDGMLFADKQKAYEHEDWYKERELKLTISKDIDDGIKVASNFSFGYAIATHRDKIVEILRKYVPDI